MEDMRTVMLKHEETFKKQVHELHRLYRIQKTLMRGMEINYPHSDHGNGIGSDRIDHEKKNPKSLEFDTGSEIELSLSLGLGPRNKGGVMASKNSDYCGQNRFSNSSTGSNRVLNRSNHGEQFRQERLNRPPWLFQVLSL